MNFIADRLKRIKPSMTVGINVKANALRAEGKDVLVLAAGEPDFDTPINIKKAAFDAMEDGQTRYVPGKGTPALQKAIPSKFLKVRFFFPVKQYPIVFKFLTNPILSFFPEILLPLNFFINERLLSCQMPILFLAKFCQGNFSPGSIFLRGAISE